MGGCVFLLFGLKTMLRFTILSSLLLTASLTGCANRAEFMKKLSDPKPPPEAKYQSLNCQQLVGEMEVLSGQEKRIQEAKANKPNTDNDAVFWVTKGDGGVEETELKNVQTERAVILKVFEEKHCVK